MGYYDAIIILSGLTFQNATQAISRAAGPVLSTLVTPNSGQPYMAKYAYSVPLVYPSITFTTFGLSFASNVAGSSGDITITMTVAEGTLLSRYGLVVKLPFFTCDSVSIDNSNAAAWDSTTSTMTIQLTGTGSISSSDGSNSVTISGCMSPSGGVVASSTYANQGLGYRLQYSSGVETGKPPLSPSLLCISRYSPFLLL